MYGGELLMSTREELIQQIHHCIGPWVALDGFTLFGSQVLAYVESMDDEQLIETARKLRLIEW